MSLARLALVAAATVAFAQVPAGHADSGYRDTVGDSGRVPDIRSVTVTNSGRRTVVVRTRTRLTAEAFLALVLDTSAKPGPERAIVVVGRTPGGRLVTIVLDGRGEAVPRVNVAGVVEAGVVRLSLPAARLGIRQRFDFWLLSGINDETTTAFDRAPNAGEWHYDLSMTSAPVRRLSGDAI